MFTMGVRKRKSGKQEETKEEDDCFHMQQKIVNLLREKVQRLEDELTCLRSHQSLLYKAWSMPIYPPGMLHCLLCMTHKQGILACMWMHTIAWSLYSVRITHYPFTELLTSILA